MGYIIYNYRLVDSEESFTSIYTNENWYCIWEYYVFTLVLQANMESMFMLQKQIAKIEYIMCTHFS